MILFEATIPGRPGIKKNSKKILRNFKTGKPFVSTSDRFKLWETQAQIIIKKAHAEYGFVSFNNYVKAEFTVSLSNHKNEPDFGNAVEGLCDLLEKCGVVKNDKLINPAQVTKTFGGEDFIQVKLFAN